MWAVTKITPRPTCQRGAQVLSPQQRQLGVLTVGAIDAQRFGQARSVAGEGLHDITLLGQERALPLHSAQVAEHPLTRFRQRQRKGGTKEFGAVFDHETGAKARASVGKAPQESAVWAEGASQ